MADGFRIGGAFFAALDGYVQDVSSAALDAGAKGLDAFTDTVRADARRSPRWAPLADSIETWDEGGALHVGVRNHLSEAAMNAEFGDDKHPPAPLLRANSRARKAASTAMSQRMGQVGMR